MCFSLKIIFFANFLLKFCLPMKNKKSLVFSMLFTTVLIFFLILPLQKRIINGENARGMEGEREVVGGKEKNIWISKWQI